MPIVTLPLVTDSREEVYATIHVNHNFACFIHDTAGDAVGVAGSGIQLASKYVPDEIGQSKLTFISNQ